jgi:hypothetical protein
VHALCRDLKRAKPSTGIRANSLEGFKQEALHYAADAVRERELPLTVP